ncbi:MAG: branched-chain amino acid ABC transporter permease [Chloroflexi bacterium]|nr:branched-chain amino acid ABC transporter permease [Chloroflexota bacterium]
MKRRIDRRWIAVVVLVALLILAPLYLRRFPYQMGVVAGAFFYAILASSWALLSGIGGQFSFAHMAFVGFGAYTAGLLGRDLGTTPLMGIIAGTLLAGVIGLIIGLLCLRLKAAYLALFTIAFSEIFRIVLLTEFKFTEGSNGLQLNKLWEGITGLQEYYVMLGLLLGTMALMYWLAGSRFGLFVRSMREDEEAAAAMGVNVVRYKVMIFVITSLIVGLAGAVFYHQVGIITPNTMEILQMSLVIAMAVIGGMESLLGAAVGAFFSRVSLELLREINLFGLHLELGAWRYAAFGVLLMLTLRFAQNGLLYPIIDRLFGQRAREETVAKRVQAAEVESS